MSYPLPPPPQAPKPAPKPIWSRWWVWVIAVVLVLFAIGIASGDSQDTAAESPSPVTEMTAPTPTGAPVTMPDLVGLSIPDALEALEPFGIHTIGQTERPSRQPEGTVLSQDPAAGRALSETTFVTVVVAQPFPRVPNVVGDKLTAARRTLENRGFDVRLKKQESSRPKDTVISQSPAGGTSARPGRLVTIIVAKPPPIGGGGGDCTPGYSPCLPSGPSDYDCAGGSGDGPAYTEPGVTYRVSGSDPYDLDADNDGSGCE